MLDPFSSSRIGDVNDEFLCNDYNELCHPAVLKDMVGYCGEKMLDILKIIM